MSVYCVRVNIYTYTLWFFVQPAARHATWSNQGTRDGTEVLERACKPVKISRLAPTSHFTIRVIFVPFPLDFRASFQHPAHPPA